MSNEQPTRFIEMTGKSLSAIINDGELHGSDLKEIGVLDDSIVRINEHGDVECRLEQRWAVIGGLLGDFENRVKEQTGLDWI